MTTRSFRSYAERKTGTSGGSAARTALSGNRDTDLMHHRPSRRAVPDTVHQEMLEVHLGVDPREIPG